MSGLEAAQRIKNEIITNLGIISTRIICVSGSLTEINSVMISPNNPFWKAEIKPLSYDKFFRIVNSTVNNNL